MAQIKNMANKIYQIQIVLRGSNPKIWRRILIPSDLLLSDLHKIIQTTMGWKNSHLHQFVKDGTFYSVKHPGDDMLEMDTIDYKKKKTRISDLLKVEKDKMIYEYDFGDSWAHDIILEEILPIDEKITYPICLTGEMNCPPEDCGGVWGYIDMLEILKQPKHKEYKSYVEWLGDEFDPTFFDIDEVNKLLRKKNFATTG